MAQINPNIQDKSGRYVVASTFRCFNDFSRVYGEGEDVSSFDTDRLTNLVKRGLVEFIPDQVSEMSAGIKEIGAKTDVEPAKESETEDVSDEAEEKPKRGRKPKNS